MFRAIFIPALVLLSVIPFPGTSQNIVINEAMPSNYRFLQDETGEYPDWIEFYNKSATPAPAEGLYLSDTRTNLLKWKMPEQNIPGNGFFLVFASGKTGLSGALYWNNLIRQGDTWKYIVPATEPSAAWRLPGFNDTSWLSGKSGIGYGDNDDATIISNCISVFMRKSFQVADTAKVYSSLLHIDYDDAFVAYINGNEIARNNIGASGTIPAWDARADGNHEALMYSGGSPEAFLYEGIRKYLKPGENILAIQIHNYGPTSSDLTGIPFFSLYTTEPPSIPPPSILNLPEAAFHTNFKIDADGDTLFLSTAAGVVTDSLIIGPFASDLSIGRKPDGTGDWFLFNEPTPKAPNNTQSYTAAWNRPVLFNPSGKFFTTSFNLQLFTGDANDSIYYTLDGSEPDKNSLLYKQAITISSTQTVRARTLKKGYLPGTIYTNTYLKDRSSNLPVIALSTEPSNFFDYNSGIYVTGPNAQSDYPYFGANFWNDWERPVHIELFEPDGSRVMAVDAGVKIFGAWSRGQPQKSLALYARKLYGAKEFNYKIFPQLELDRFETLVLRNSGNDWYGGGAGSGTLMRDLLHTRLAIPWGVEAQAGRQAVLYLNGQYYGIHNIREKVNEHFLSAHSGVDKDNINILEGNAQVVQGSNSDYLSLMNFIQLNDVSRAEVFMEVERRMDIENFINYSIIQIYIDNGDWPGNNIKYWKPADGSGLWRWILYDTDFGFGMWDLNKVYTNTLEFALRTDGPGWPNPPWSTLLLRTLMKNTEFKKTFINRFADRLNSSLLPDSVKAQILILRNGIKDEIPLHAARWGEGTVNWNNQVDRLNSFASLRPAVARSFISTTLNIPGPYQFVLSNQNNHMGSVKVNSLLIKEQSWSGYYFGYAPVSLTAIPAPGYKFVGWSGASTSTSASIKIALSGVASISPGFAPDIAPDPNPVVINEICYRAQPGKDSEDWVELYNRTSNHIDLTGWILRDGTVEGAWMFPQNTILGPNGFLVVCRSQAAFSFAYPGITNKTGDFGFGLGSLGDCVRLYDNNGNLADSVCFGVSSPWPDNTSGTGYTLSLRSPGFDNSIPENWRASVEIYGTPGSFNGTNSIQNEPNTVVLFNPYPNPFRSTITIPVYAGKPEQVSLRIFDLSGKLIETIAQQEWIENTVEFTWTPSGHNPGIYVVRLETSGTVKYQKIVYSHAQSIAYPD